MTTKRNKILFTGGHASSTAYALITHIINTGRKWEMYWLGPASFIEGRSVKSLENREFDKIGVKYYSINAGRLQRKFTRYTIPSLLKIPQGFIQAIILLIKLKPDVVFSFGGFVGFPVVLGAYILRIPVIVHEQTSAAGRANIASAKFAAVVALARKSSKKYFRIKNIEITGNPIDLSTLNVSEKETPGNPPVIFVTGGHTGSLLINNNLQKALPELLKSYKVVHQTGSIDIGKLLKYKENLPSALGKNYTVFDTVEPERFAHLMGEADIIVSRAGANTVSKLMIIKRPSLLIPIPYSYLNEQYLNAMEAKDFGIAEVLEEKDLNEEVLIEIINKIYRNWKDYILRTKDKISPDLEASGKLTALIEKYL